MPEQEQPALPERGWYFLENSTKFHYFDLAYENGRISLCRRYGVFVLAQEDLHDEHHDHAQNCAPCRRAREKRATKAAKEQP